MPFLEFLVLVTVVPAWVMVTGLSLLWCLASKSRNRQALTAFAAIWCTAWAAILSVMFIDTLWKNIIFVAISLGGVAFARFLDHITKPS
ncbi:MAG: hypothetical protein H7Y17_03805 [Chlorobia bacterium]|nr:hypothetical protein [Fimbriimonadaceae bacterium]